MIFDSIEKLVQYGIEKDLITPQDKNYVINRILEILNLDEFIAPAQNYENINLETTLKEILDYAVEKKIIEDSIVYRDLFDTKILARWLYGKLR